MFESRPDRDHEILLLGRSNVGKSTLMAELTGHSVETGQRPGVTQAPNYFDWTHPSVVLTDLPGFGFMAGVPDDERERIKTGVVQYVERAAEDALVAILVVDGKAVIDIIDRHTGPDEVAHVVELFALLRELEIPTVVAVNKMDKVPDRDERLAALCDRLGLPGPWQQWQDTVAPITAKRGSIGPLESAVREHLHAAGRDDVIGLLF